MRKCRKSIQKWNWNLLNKYTDFRRFEVKLSKVLGWQQNIYLFFIHKVPFLFIFLLHFFTKNLISLSFSFFYKKTLLQFTFFVFEKITVTNHLWSIKSISKPNFSKNRTSC